jgi:hypothetical protein
MSTTPTISQEIAALEASKRLVRYEPRRRKPKRRLYLGQAAVHELTAGSSAFGILGMQGRIRDVLERWTLGDRVWTDPDGKPRLLKPLFPPPPEVWELMVIEPGAQVRIFCIFAEPDTLIVSQMNTRKLLGKRNSKIWKEAKDKCDQHWKSLFPHPPFKGETIHDYVTENCDDFPV